MKFLHRKREMIKIIQNSEQVRAGYNQPFIRNQSAAIELIIIIIEHFHNVTGTKDPAYLGPNEENDQGGGQM